jgi:hypothetical protein
MMGTMTKNDTLHSNRIAKAADRAVKLSDKNLLAEIAMWQGFWNRDLLTGESVRKYHLVACIAEAATRGLI